MKRGHVLAVASLTIAGSALGQSRTYTLDADFDEGTLLNVNHDAPNHDQLQLNETTEPFPFVNIACSARGTVVRIDVNTCVVQGEYRTAPAGMGLNPSRTTVDQFGNVWVANRAENGDIGGVLHGSITRIGLVIGGTRVDQFGNSDPTGQYLAPPFDYNTCVDRHGATVNDPPDGLIKTSFGLGNFLDWSNAGGADTLGGVSTAEDECIINYVRVPATGTRTVAIDANNNVWVGGIFGFGPNHNHVRVDVVGTSANVNAGTFFNVGCGGYGGFIDGAGVLWSAGQGTHDLLRYDTGTGMSQCLSGRGDYGLGLDPNTGNLWHSGLVFSNNVHELAPDGTLLNFYPQGFGAQGLAVDSNSHVWVAEIFGSRVAHYAPDPLNPGMHLFVGNVAGFSGTTGVAVDANGKIWASEINSSLTRGAARIDPNAGPIGNGGFNIGAIDCTVGLNAAGLPSAGPYNYSDMTGFVLLSAIENGIWTVVFDTGSPGTEECAISWNGEPEGAEPAGTSITVAVRAADALIDLPAEVFEPVSNGGTAVGVAGQFWQIQATLDRDPGVDDTPVLSDLTIECNEPPTIDCPDPVTAECTSPDGAEVTLTVTVEDNDGDDLTVTWEVDAAVVQVDNVAGGGPADVMLTQTYSLGAHAVTVTVDDGQADPVSCNTSVTVEDTTGPVVTVGPLVELWPPNHKYVTLSLADCVVSVEDACDGSLDIEAVGSIVSIYSDEPEDVGGGDDGHTFDDIVILGPTSFKVRAERQGGSNGRVYGITFDVTDAEGNTTTAICFVGVPHDQSGAPPIDDGPGAGYTVFAGLAGNPGGQPHKRVGATSNHSWR